MVYVLSCFYSFVLQYRKTYRLYLGCNGIYVSSKVIILRAENALLLQSDTASEMSETTLLIENWSMDTNYSSMVSTVLYESQQIIASCGETLSVIVRGI